MNNDHQSKADCVSGTADAVAPGAHDLPLQSGLGLGAPPRAAPTGQDEFAAAARAVADRSTATDDWGWEVVAGTSLAHVRHQSSLPCMKIAISLSVATFVGN